MTKEAELAEAEKPKTETEPPFGLITTDVRFAVEDGRTILEGVMLEPGEFKTSTGPKIVTPAFIAKTMPRWVGKKLKVVDASHPNKPPVTVDLAKITKTGVNERGQGVFRATAYRTTLARDIIAMAEDDGRLGVSIDGPIKLAADRKTMLDMESPNYLAVLPLGDQAIPNSYVEVAAFSAGAGAFDSLNDKEGKHMDEKETQALKEQVTKAQTDVAKFSADLAKVNDELTTVRAQRDMLLIEKNEAERLRLLDETAKFAKKCGDKEPAVDAKLDDLRALRAGQAEKAYAKFAEGKTAGAELQKTAPPVAGSAAASKPKRIVIVD